MAWSPTIPSTAGAARGSRTCTSFARISRRRKLYRLEQNYRSTAAILDAANALIANNTGRLGKTLWTSGARGEPVKLYAAYNERDEADFVVTRILEWTPARRPAAREPRSCIAPTRSRAASRRR